MHHAEFAKALAVQDLGPNWSEEGLHVRIGRTTLLVALGVLLVVEGQPTANAQAVAQQQAALAVTAQRIPLTAGRSTVLLTEFEIVRIAVTNPTVADARRRPAARSAD